MGRCFCYLSGDCRYVYWCAMRFRRADASACALRDRRIISSNIWYTRLYVFSSAPSSFPFFYIESKYCRLNIFFVSSNVRDGNKPDNSSERGWIRTVVFELMEIIVARDLSRNKVWENKQIYISYVYFVRFFYHFENNWFSKDLTKIFISTGEEKIWKF